MILVVGATGSVGGKIAQRLLTNGKSVRIVVRPGSDAQALVDAGAEPVEADLKDPSSLRAAVDGVDTVVTTANSAKRGEPDNPKTVDLEGNASLIDAAKAAGVRRFVFLSALGADAESPVEFIAAKGKTERRLRESGMDYTIIAPNIYMDVWVAMVVAAPALAGSEVAYVGSGERKHSMIAEDDVADFAVAAIDSDDARNDYIALGGPVAISWRDAVAAFERALGRSIPQRGVAPGEVVPGLPPSPTIQGLVTSMDGYDSPMEMSDTAARFGVRQRTLDDWVADLLQLERAR